MSKKRMAIDFDGVIHAYTQGWQDGVIYDQPVEGALETMEALSRLYDVYIFTTRGSDPVQVEAITLWIRSFQSAKKLPDRDYEITDKKLPATVYLDDRAIRFTNWRDFRKLYD